MKDAIIFASVIVIIVVVPMRIGGFAVAFTDAKDKQDPLRRLRLCKNMPLHDSHHKLQDTGKHVCFKLYWELILRLFISREKKMKQFSYFTRSDACIFYHGISFGEGI